MDLAAPEREKLEQGLMAVLNKALRQVPFVRLDAVDAVTAEFQSVLEFMEANLDIGDSDDDSTGAVDENSKYEPDLTLPAAPTDRGRLGISATSAAGAPSPTGGIPLAAATIATKLIGSTVTRDYSSPSQNKRSLGKRGSFSATAAAVLSSTAPATSSTSAASITVPAPTSTTTPSTATKLGLGLKSSAAANSNTTASATANSTTTGLSTSTTSTNSASGSKSALGLSLATAHKPSSRAQAAIANNLSTDDEQGPDSANAYSSGQSSGQSSDNEEEVIRVARPLTSSAAKNVLLSRAAGLSSSREFPSPKLGPRSLGASPASVGPRGVSAPNKHAPIAIGQGLGSGSKDAPALVSPNNELGPVLTAPPDFVHPAETNVSASALGEDVPLILTEPGELGKANELSTKEALNLPDDALEEKDLVDEALEKCPDPLTKLKNEVIVPVTASPTQFKSSLKLLTLAAKSAAGEEAEEVAVASGHGHGYGQLSGGDAMLGTSLASMPSGASSGSPSSSTNSTPKPAFLRRLDSPESHHGQLIAAKAKLSMIINRAIQTIPSLKGVALGQCQRKLDAALALLEKSTVQT